jgi:DNA repair ATPase RecN
LVDDRTHTEVIPLVGSERRNELAQMLGPVGEGTLQSIDEILQIVSEHTNKAQF